MKAFVINHAIDVLCLQEANGWQEGDPSRMEDFANSTGLSHAVFGDSNTASKLAVFSQVPIGYSRLHTAQFWHCAMQIGFDIGGQTLELWNTHLNPFDEDKRLLEAAFIAGQAQDAIIVGDMNSLSRQDRYPDKLAQNFQDLGNTRYGDGLLRYDVTDHFVENGFVDAAASARKIKLTFPARTDCENSPQPMRLDYMFVQEGLARTILDVAVVKNGLTARISDHYPLVTTLALPSPKRNRQEQPQQQIQRRRRILQAA